MSLFIDDISSLPRQASCSSWTEIIRLSSEQRGLGDCSIRTGRKTRKFEKKSKEPVWPPHLEAALLEGLECYVPSSTREFHLLQRFPRRNKEISNYIFQKTNTRRSAKQVGSRLQQLRETCPDEYVLRLIKSKNFGPERTSLLDRRRNSLAPSEVTSASSFWPSDSSTGNTTLDMSFSSTSTADIPPFPTPSPTYSAHSRITVILTLFEFDIYATSEHPNFTLDLDEQVLVEPSLPRLTSTFTRRAELRTGKAISQYTPIVNFSSLKFSTGAQFKCLSEIFCNGILVYSSETYLERYILEYSPCSISCRAMLVPEFWSVIASNINDLRSYTLVQTIASEGHPDSSILFSIDYTFESGFDIQQAPLYAPTPVYQGTVPTPSAYDYIFPQNAYSYLDNSQFPHNTGTPRSLIPTSALYFAETTKILYDPYSSQF